MANRMAITTNMFWDCECEEDYIRHRASEGECPRCDAREEDQPDSRIDEVNDYIAALIHGDR